MPLSSPELADPSLSPAPAPASDPAPDPDPASPPDIDPALPVPPTTRRGRLARVGFLLLTLAAGAYAVARQWGRVRAGFADL
ncbi:MAG: hypothetical protein HOW97_36490, partial [Catenulispora sp.]|nr:hypothetical protein [Catenulispora sp.]